MVYKSLGKKTISMLLAMSFIATSCMPGDVASTRQGFNAATPEGESTSGSGAGNTTSGTTGGAGTTTINPTVEIRHLIEPNLSNDPNYSSGTGYAGGGSYVRKLTLPKNFAGKLYLAGINISTLANRHVKVRFKFGVNSEPITITGVVATAPGITPQTNIHVLVLDLRSEPFRTVRLPYDLYDYNDYSVPGSTPTQNNRDSGLFCRGLQVTDDPTFTGVGQCDGLQAGEECLYSYAKVVDQGLIKKVVTTTTSGTTTTLVPVTLSLPQVRSVSGTSYYQDYMAKSLIKPLADNTLGPFKFSEPAPSTTISDSILLDFKKTLSPITLDFAAKTINSEVYYYRGPYRLVDSVNWHFQISDPVGPNKLFRNSRPYVSPTPADPLAPTPEKSAVFFGSYMFPLATKISLSAGVPHLSSEIWSDPRVENTLPIAGQTAWMDGSNARVQSKNNDLEHIGSCNVSATIEIIAKDDNLNEYIVALSNEVKLQLVRPTVYYTDTGTDVLYTNFKTCSSNSSCGGNECCFNNRCWDQSLVSQCFDSSNTQGNLPVGDSCLTDLDCTSLCCNRSSGLCSPHNTLLSPAVSCSKPIGDFCIAKEWCSKSPVVKCLVVKTGTDTCRQQCYTTEEYGDCKAGTCTAPVQPPITTFDPNAPDACANAVPAPNF